MARVATERLVGALPRQHDLVRPPHGAAQNADHQRTRVGDRLAQASNLSRPFREVICLSDRNLNQRHAEHLCRATRGRELIEPRAVGEPYGESRWRLGKRIAHDLSDHRGVHTSG